MKYVRNPCVAVNIAADGIYFFNHFLPESDNGAISYYLNENGKMIRYSHNILDF